MIVEGCPGSRADAPEDFEAKGMLCGRFFGHRLLEPLIVGLRGGQRCLEGGKHEQQLVVFAMLFNQLTLLFHEQQHTL